jgi:hypothetical protein
MIRSKELIKRLWLLAIIVLIVSLVGWQLLKAKRYSTQTDSKKDNIVVAEQPDSLTKDEISRLLWKGNKKEIWKAQDAIMRTWPDYSKICVELIKQIAFNDNTPVQELVEKAITSRAKFWEAGGGLSSDSYQHVYKARILLELAHEREPQNLTITDELVETIQAAYPLFFFNEQANKKIRRDEIDKILLGLRSSQFEQIRKEVQQGRNPSKHDFIRAVELAIILSIYDVAKAKETVDWLQHEAIRGGWNRYYTRLEEFQGYLDQGEPFCFAIYRFNNNSPPVRYQRRYPSFRGPTPQKRGITLIGFDD